MGTLRVITAASCPSARNQVARGCAPASLKIDESITPVHSAWLVSPQTSCAAVRSRVPQQLPAHSRQQPRACVRCGGERRFLRRRGPGRQCEGSGSEGRRQHVAPRQSWCLAHAVLYTGQRSTEIVGCGVPFHVKRYVLPRRTLPTTAGR